MNLECVLAHSRMHSMVVNLVTLGTPYEHTYPEGIKEYLHTVSANKRGNKQRDKLLQHSTITVMHVVTVGSIVTWSQWYSVIKVTVGSSVTWSQWGLSLHGHSGIALLKSQWGLALHGHSGV